MSQINRVFNSYKKFINNYANFNGRSSRSDYWDIILFNFLLGLFVHYIIPFIPSLIFTVTIITIMILSTTYLVFLIIPSIALSIRRLHDTNRSGWNCFWVFLPLIGIIILLILLCEPSVNENNKYGDLVQ